eukprot:391585-Rhodomonas_salina.1
MRIMTRCLHCGQSPIRVYCHDMASESPREFITLAKPESNWVYWSLTSEDESVPARKNHFEKLRVKFHKGRVHVNTKDFTFTDGLKEHVQSDWYRFNTGVSNERDIVQPQYGSAWSCDGRQHSASVDLSGLPLHIAASNFFYDSWANLAYGGAASFWGDEADQSRWSRFSTNNRLSDASDDRKAYTVSVGGWCRAFHWMNGHCTDDGFFCLALDYEPMVLPRT